MIIPRFSSTPQTIQSNNAGNSCKCCDKKRSLPAVSWKSTTPLELAKQRGQWEMAFVLEKGFQQLATRLNNQEYSAAATLLKRSRLPRAAINNLFIQGLERRGEFDALFYINQMGADPNYCTAASDRFQFGQTALAVAILNGLYMIALRLLLEVSRRTLVKTIGQCILYSQDPDALPHVFRAILRYKKPYRYHWQSVKFSGDQNVLHLAVNRKARHLANLLIASGVSPDWKEDTGTSGRERILQQQWSSSSTASTAALPHQGTDCSAAFWLGLRPFNPDPRSPFLIVYYWRIFSQRTPLFSPISPIICM